MRIVLASALIAGVGLTAPACAVECPSGLGIYRTTISSTHELIFTNSDSGTLELSKGKLKASYPFSITYSNGFSRTYINFSGKHAPSSVVMSFEPDFKPFGGQGAAPFLVIPDLTSSFYYWDELRSKYGYDLLPGDTWRLAGCTSGNMMGPGRRP